MTGADRLTKFERKEVRFLEKVWETGRLGKVLIVFYALLAISPIFLEAWSIYSQRDWIVTLPSTVIDRIAILSFVVATLFFLGTYFLRVLRAIMADLL